MAIENILVAYDESEGAKKALDIAISIAELNEDVHIDVVYVVPIPLLDNQQARDFSEILDMMIEDGRRVLTEAVEPLEDVAEQVDTLIVTGTNPANEIVKLTKDRPCDLIVIGNRGLTGMKEYLGSVSHKVLHLVDIPVLIAK